MSEENRFLASSKNVSENKSWSSLGLVVVVVVFFVRLLVFGQVLFLAHIWSVLSWNAVFILKYSFEVQWVKISCL